MAQAHEEILMNSRKAANSRSPALTFALCLALGPLSCHSDAPEPNPPPAKASWPATGGPLIIPTPKSLTLAGPRLRLNKQTRLVIAEDATEQDKRAAWAVQGEMLARFGPPALPLVRAGTVTQAENLLAFGEPSRVPLVARLLRKAGGVPPTKAEGYCVRTAPGWAVVAGHDPAGTFYGAQTLSQLISQDYAGPFLWPARVDDYPSLPWRGAHLFVGNRALPFHEKLIAGVFARLKMNALVLQCEQAQWDTLGPTAPTWAMSKADLRREIIFAREHFLSVTPLVNSVGHMPWLLDNAHYRNWAEDPQTPYAASVTNPDLDTFLFRLYDEVLDTFHSDTLHIGGDEVTLRGRYPFSSRAQYPTVATAFVAQVTKMHDYLASKNVRTMLWGDMLLASGEGPDACNAPSPADAAWMRGHLPKDITITDWHYAPEGDFASPRLLTSAGFAPVIGATWYNPANVAVFSHALAADRQRGLLQTTWAGYNSSAGNLQHESQQFIAFVIAAEEAWNGGKIPADRLPYDPHQVFWALYGAGKNR